MKAVTAEINLPYKICVVKIHMVQKRFFPELEKALKMGYYFVVHHIPR